eukprot:4324491-Prorocentrum_lima.AAC.1
MEKRYEVYKQDPSAKNLEEVDRAEDWLLSQTDYQACIEYGEQQTEYLKALDFMDILSEKL